MLKCNTSENFEFTAKFSMKTYAKGKKMLFSFSFTALGLKTIEMEKFAERNALKPNNAFQFTDFSPSTFFSRPGKRSGEAGKRLQSKNWEIERTVRELLMFRSKLWLKFIGSCSGAESVPLNWPKLWCQPALMTANGRRHIASHQIYQNLLVSLQLHSKPSLMIYCDGQQRTFVVSRSTFCRPWSLATNTKMFSDVWQEVTWRCC